MRFIFSTHPLVLSLPTLPALSAPGEPSTSFVPVLLLCAPVHCSSVSESSSKVHFSQTSTKHVGKRCLKEIYCSPLRLNPHPDLRGSFLFVSPPLCTGVKLSEEGKKKSSSTAAFKVSGASWSGWDPTAAAEQTERVCPRRALCWYPASFPSDCSR